MLALYLGTLGFGAVLIGTSLVLGGGDTDHDVDKDLDAVADVDVEADGDLDLEAEVDLDHDADLDQDADADHGGDHALATTSGGHGGHGPWSWLPFLSLRFWSFGSAAFGATGTLLTLGAVPTLVAAPVSAVTGLGVGSAATWFFRQLRKDMVTGETRLDRYVGETAVVVLTVRPGDVGQVRLTTASGDVLLRARTRDRHELPRGSKAIIASFDGREASVTGLPELPGASDA